MKTLITILVLFSFSNSILADLTDNQKDILIAVHVKSINVGHQEILQGIAMQETLAGELNKGNRDGMKYFHKKDRPIGIMQTKPDAVRHVLSTNTYLHIRWFNEKPIKKITYQEIRDLLLNNDMAAIDFGIAYFEIMLKTSKGNVAKAIAAYNLGYGNVMKLDQPKKYKYVVKVNNWIKKEIRPFNKHVGLVASN